MIEIYAPKMRCKACKGALEIRGQWLLCARCRKATLLAGIGVLPRPGLSRDVLSVSGPATSSGPGTEYERDEHDVDESTVAAVLELLRIRVIQD